MKRLLVLSAALLASAGSASAQSAAQQQAFCTGILSAVAGAIYCPNPLEEVGGAAIGVVCVGNGGQNPRPGGDQLEAQLRLCLPPGWTASEFRSGLVANRDARYREYVRRTDGRRVRVGEFIYRTDRTPRNARATIVETRQAFVAIPPFR